MKLKNLFKLTILFVLLPVLVFAEDFKSIKIDADIDRDGVAKVKEVWEIDEDNKDYTERYKRIENLQGIKIENFSVNALGRDFTEKMPWDIDASFEDKAYHYGRIDKEDQVELTWGISEFKDNIYNLSYTINPLVVGLKDADMVYFNFVGYNFSPKPEKVEINIKGFEAFKDVEMWGFGLKGEIHNVDGVIQMKSTDYVDYATVMLKFPKGYFNTAYKLDKNFDDYANMAAKGSDWENREGQAYQEPMSNTEKSVLGLVGALVLGVVYFVARDASLSFNKRKIENKKSLPTIKDLKGEYYKKLPYDGPMEDLSYFIGQAYLVTSDLVGNYINAFILKWSLEGAIEFIEEGKGFADNKIKILKRPEDMGPMEGELFDMINAANEESQEDFITAKAFKRYVKDHKKEMENYYEEFQTSSIRKLREEGYLEDYVYEKKFLFSRRTGKELRVTEKGKVLYENLIKFKNYLKDCLDEVTEEVDFKDWEEYLIYSSIFFLDKEFVKGAKAYPAYCSEYSVYNANLIATRNFSSKLNRSYQSGTGFASPGAGGATSVGGGGGSFGGGGGGGR